MAGLCLILALVGLTTCQDQYRSSRWREPLFVAIYPIAADDSPVTRGYIDSLDGETFKPVDLFFGREAARHHLRTAEPFRSRLRAELKTRPPERPAAGGPLSTVIWSLKLRYWAWSVSRRTRAPEDVRIFVLYHDPKLAPTVPHSLGLTKGLLGVVHAFADAAMNGANDVLIAHEMLHTVGATDKYNPLDDAPRFPEGFGDPRQVPLLPQRYAELMAGRRVLARDRWQQPSSLEEVVVGPATALEIRWLKHAE